MQSATQTTATPSPLLNSLLTQYPPMEQPETKPDRDQFTAPFPPLEHVTKPNLTTNELAFYLNRKPQTLRAWACHEDGPLRPRRIGGLLAWATIEVKALCGVSQ